MIEAINVHLEGITKGGEGRTISLVTEAIYLNKYVPFPDPIKQFTIEVYNDKIDVYDQIRGRKKHICGQISVGFIEYFPTN